MIASRRANRSDLKEIIELEEEFKTDLFFCSEANDILKCIDCGGGIVCTSTDTGKIMAFLLMSITEYQTAYVEKIFVHPSIRGRSLQRTLTIAATNKIMNAKVCYTMVHPRNIISLANFKKCGFIEKWRTKYKGQERIVLVYEANS